MKSIFNKLKLVTLFLFFILITSNAFSQENKELIILENKDSISSKTNPIIFADFTLGYTNGSIRGLGAVLNLNYQHKSDLFTLRFGGHFEIRELELFIFIPVSKSIISNDEFSLMYGKRYVNGGFSYHFSGGLSYNIYRDLDEKVNRDIIVNYVGFPLEVGVSWFKEKKARFRVLYGLIPVGKPTAFGRSIGFKLYANITKKAYFGIGINFGLGYHKKY